MEDLYGEETAQRLADRTWIQDVAELGLVIYSKDDGLRSDPEVSAIKGSGAKVFLLPNAQMTGEEQIGRYISHQHRISLRAKKRGCGIWILYREQVTKMFP